MSEFENDRESIDEITPDVPGFDPEMDGDAAPAPEAAPVPEPVKPKVYPPYEEALAAGKMLHAACAQVGAPLCTYWHVGDGSYQIREYPVAGHGVNPFARFKIVAENLNYLSIVNFTHGLMDCLAAPKCEIADYLKGHNVGRELQSAGRLYPKFEVKDEK